MEDRLMKIEELAVMVGSSVQTINMWYRFKRANPENEYAKMLPEYIQEYPKATRYWTYSDVYKLAEFKSSIPQGRKGVLGIITQKYVKKRKEKEHATT